MNNIRLISNPAFAGSLYTGQVDVNLSVKVDLRLSGIYEASGFLFPYVDQIQFDSSGEWFTYISLVMTQRHHISTSVSIDGSITSEFSMSRYEPETFISHFYFDNFLEDHINQWYYPIAKEGFGKELEERAHRAFIYNEINVFREFFEKVFYVSLIQAKTFVLIKNKKLIVLLYVFLLCRISAIRTLLEARCKKLLNVRLNLEVNICFKYS